MDETLKSIYLRLDSTTKSLTKNAISQLLIKIIYAMPYKSDKIILSEYKNIAGLKNINEDELKNNLDLLVKDRNIIRQKGLYHISTNKQEKITLSYQESIERKKQIIETYFKPFFSTENTISDWLFDSTIFFFKQYSKEWISDLCYKASTMTSSKDNILASIENKTKSNKNLDKKDINDLPTKFVSFITTKDPTIDAYLWEYGTSSFAAQLIKNSVGADNISIETFKNCNCILDTNILMHIGLELSEYNKTLKLLENVFEELNINIGILNITKEEYQNTVGKKKDEIIKMIEKYPLNVVKEADDQYIQTAIARKCYDTSDFDRFFSQLLEIPKYLEHKIKINIFNHDAQLNSIIEKAQNDVHKQSELNSIFKQITGHDKRQNALIHDVGLIAGVNYLREKEEKYFILSQEVSVNNYAKQKPSIKNLPISIRLETIINVLAVNNGGVNINTQDYIPLFASMIRDGILPNKDAFKVADLSLMLEKNEQISSLPSEDTIRIAKEVHRQRLLGEDEEKIALEMTRQIQGVKIRIVDDLQETKVLLSNEKEEKTRYKNRAEKTVEALRKTTEKELTKEYSKRIRSKRIIFYLYLPLFIIFIFTILWLLYYYLIGNQNNFWGSIIIALCINFITDIIIIIFNAIPQISSLKKNKKAWIESETEKRLQKQLE